MIAIVLSLLLHLLLLVAVRLQGAGTVPRVAFTVSLRAPAVAPAPAPATAVAPPEQTPAREVPGEPQVRSPAPPDAAPAPAVAPQSAPAAPAPDAAPPPEPAPPVAAAPQVPPPPAQLAGEAAPGDPRERLQDSEPWNRQPQPLEPPQLADVAQQLRARRITVDVSLDARGTVLGVRVPPRELSPELVARIEQAVSQVRFLPAREEGRAVPAALRTLLCFDDAGALDMTSAGCWMAETPAAR